MKDKEKQINEMAKEIQNAVDGCAEYWTKLIAKSLCDKGYRKLPKDYENIYEQAEQNVLANIADGGTSCHWCIEQHEKKASKETAEKIYWALRKECFSPLRGYYESDGFSAINWVLKDMLAKQFGVEIKE